MAKKQEQKQIAPADFVTAAIIKLRDESKSPGIHSVFSGLNEALREYYGRDPVEITKELEQQGVIKTRPVKRGVMVYLPGELPQGNGSNSKGKQVIDKVLS